MGSGEDNVELGSGKKYFSGRCWVLKTLSNLRWDAKNWGFMSTK